MKRIIIALISGITSVLLLGGCVAAIGNRDAKTSTTLGQQLVDLQKAKDAGALSPSEFEEQKARLLERYK